MKSKQLEVHPDKTCHIVIGNEKSVKDTAEQIDQNPIVYDNFTVNRVKESKYLGDLIHHGGNSSSIVHI